MMKIVFFDLDGILADFWTGSIRAHGLDVPPIGTLSNWNFWRDLGMSDDEFWRPLHSPDVWADLPLCADGVRLFRMVEMLVRPERIGFLSSGSCPGSVDGKRRWLDRHFPGYAKSACYLTNKGLVGGPNKVLVDDFDGNTDQFVMHGGHAVLVPRPWNRRKAEADPDTGAFDPHAVFGELKALLGEG